VDNTGPELVAFNYTSGQVGSVTTNGSSTAYNTTSGERLKSDRGTAETVPELMALRVHRFVWNATKKSDVGLFAQEAYKVLPNIVTEGGADPRKNPWQVNYPGLIPRLLVGWQNHEKRIEQLEKEDRKQAAQISSNSEMPQLLKLIDQLEDHDNAEAAEISQLQRQMKTMQQSLTTRVAQNHLERQNGNGLIH